jgi:GTPase SAR1 family protein
VNYDESLSNLAELNKWYREHVTDVMRNEATTRLHLIDTLLFECLDWDKKANCIAEDRYDGKYTDYSLSARQRLLIVEAKKEGIYFELPVGQSRLIYPISFFQKNHAETYTAIQQAVGYCLSRGTPFGAVCNGHQFIAFLGSRTDGLPPMEGKCLAFPSIDSMQAEFFQPWQCLSKPGIQAHQLSLLLQEGGPPPPPEKLSKRLVTYPGYKGRNSLQTDLQILGELFLHDITRGVDQRDFLKHCYCESGALSQYAMVSKTILQTRYSLLFEKAIGGPALSPLKTKEGIDQRALAESVSKRPIVLLGDVGVGKTSFINNFIHVEAQDIVSNAIVFYINLGVKPTVVIHLRRYVADEIVRQLLQIHKIDLMDTGFVNGVYHGEIQRFERGIHSELKKVDEQAYLRKKIEFLEDKVSNVETHLKSSLEHIAKGREKQIILFLDNIDQRPYEFQQEVFLIAQSIAETWPAAVYVSIRPDTFYKSKAAGSLSAYHPKAFTISPPRADKVLFKRLAYSLHLLESGKLTGLQKIQAQLGVLKTYIYILQNSFEKNLELMECIDNLCGGNIRVALDFIHAFVGSGHVNTSKILSMFQEVGSYVIPLHEFLRAVIYGDHEYFDPDTSPVVNVFDISSVDGREHFLLLIILAQLDRWSAVVGSEGYVAEASIIEFCQSLGFQPGQIDFALRRALAKKLVEIPAKVADVDEKSSQFWRITSVGGYYHRKLVTRFEYVDAMIVDTPITDQVIRGRIQDASSIEDRLTRCGVFLSYLREQWNMILGQGLAFEYSPVEQAIMEQMRKIQQRIPSRGQRLF